MASNTGRNRGPTLALPSDDREGSQLAAGGRAELREHVAHVPLDRLDAHEKRRCDLAVGEPGGCEPHHLALDRRQLTWRGRPPADPPELGAGARRPGTRAEPLEAHRCPLERLARGSLA